MEVQLNLNVQKCWTSKNLVVCLEHLKGPSDSPAPPLRDASQRKGAEPSVKVEYHASPIGLAVQSHCSCLQLQCRRLHADCVRKRSSTNLLDFRVNCISNLSGNNLDFAQTFLRALTPPSGGFALVLLALNRSVHCRRIVMSCSAVQKNGLEWNYFNKN